MNFSSDNSYGVAEEIMSAVVAANRGAAASYGGDEWTARVHQRLRDVFECDIEVNVLRIQDVVKGREVFMGSAYKYCDQREDAEALAN